MKLVRNASSQCSAKPWQNNELFLVVNDVGERPMDIESTHRSNFLTDNQQRIVELTGAVRHGWEEYIASANLSELDPEIRALLVRVIETHLSRTEESANALLNLLRLVRDQNLKEESLLALALWT